MSHFDARISFDTSTLRESVLQAWRLSPTRFREDANTEEDLKLGGYRDRLLVELAQNAADAAGSSGILRLSIVDRELRAANTGAPLTDDGIAALASLRASAKSATTSVGQFGVGFAAALTVTDEPRVVSTSGGVLFSAQRTRQTVADIPELATVLSARGDDVPILRLVWPVDAGEPPVPTGFDTEVRLPLRANVDEQALLEQFRAAAPDLLLALSGLSRIDIADETWRREDRADGTTMMHSPAGTVLWALHRTNGQLAPTILSELGVEARLRPEWAVCWAVRLDERGVPIPEQYGVLHAPTPTDDRLSLPARLFASVQLEPTRRHLLPSKATDAVLTEAARSYPQLLNVIAPQYRVKLVPTPDFPQSEIDDRLRDKVFTELRSAPWLPLQAGNFSAPSAAVVLDSPSAELAELLVDVIDRLVVTELSAPSYARQLAALGTGRVRIADLMAVLAGIDREPQWWHRLYATLDPIAKQDAMARQELAALPIPLLDGRTVIGPRGALLVDFDEELANLSAVDFAADSIPLRIVHPDAAHPLLIQLGTQQAGPGDLLDALRPAVENSLADVESGLDRTGLIDVVLNLAAAAGVQQANRPWLGQLALPDYEGDFRRADELLLPEARLRSVLADQEIGNGRRLGLLSDEISTEWPAQLLTAIGVLDTFAVITEENPIGPDHYLADEEEWWSWIDGDIAPPEQLLAIRDLDLVDETCWPAALRLLSAEPDTWRAVIEPDGYTGWWLARYALLAGRAPQEWCLASAHDLLGLYEPIPDVGLSEDLLIHAGVRTTLSVDSTADVAELLQRLGAPGRDITCGVAMRTYALLAHAVQVGQISVSEVDAPERLRTLDGSSIAADHAVVLDVPWLLAVLPGNRIVAADPDHAEALAELLDLPLAADECTGWTLSDPGTVIDWSELDAVAIACDVLGLSLPEGSFNVHDQLAVRKGDTENHVEWWVTDDGVVHAQDSAPGLSRALAWTLDRWSDRHVLTALLDDPTGQCYLR